MKAMLSFCMRSIFSVIFTFFLLLSSFASSFAEIKNANEYQDMIIGRDSAKVTVVEYASFTCPHCATFHREVFPKLKEEYLDTGKVKFIYREVYFDAPGLWAGLLARCTANAIVGPGPSIGMWLTCPNFKLGPRIPMISSQMVLVRAATSL